LLRLYQSNRPESLMALLAGVLAVPLGAPFAPEIVVVQGKGMERWVSLRLAEQLGVCANVEFPQPASYAWQLMRSALGNLPQRSVFAPEVLVWRIMDWLARPASLGDAPGLRGYLEGGGDARRYELALRLAEVFDQYLVYRPDWIIAWQRGESRGLGADEVWQAALWRHLAADFPDSHWVALMGQLFERLDTAEALSLPERVTLFGISSLSPLYLEMLHKLAHRTEVHVFALNPSREYWELIRDPREQARLAGSEEAAELYLETGNPLLASLGKQGRDFFGALAGFGELESRFQDTERERATLLQVLQTDILDLADPESSVYPLQEIADGDVSVQIHACHGPMREMEVLHDQLLRLFAEHPGLSPGDVAVLAPDIAIYAPYIEAVFAAREGVPYIPHAAPRRAGGEGQRIAATFLTLLDLPTTRFSAEWVLGLLEQPAVLRRFGLAEDDLSAIHRWVRETGIRWGRDAAHKGELGLPASPRHTWRDGLNRLLLGFALPQDAGDEMALFGEVSPYDDVEGSRAQVAGCFAEFVETLFELADGLQGEYPLAQWAERLNWLIERLFDPQGDEEAALHGVLEQLSTLRELAGQAQFAQPVGIAVVKSWLGAQLEAASDGASLSGAVTFSALAPLRGLPFQVICLLGMNDGAFPRRQEPAGFDLIAAHPRPGDRSRRLDDRYLFLETLLAARQVLYLSYVGQDIRDNRELPPSVLVSELLDTVRASCGGEVAERIVVHHALQPFSPIYFQGDPVRPGFSPAWLAAAREAGQGGALSQPLFGVPLPEPEEEWRSVELDALLRFYAHPARYLLRERLGIRLEDSDAEFAGREPFGLDYATRTEVRGVALASRLHGKDEEALRFAEARGLLPHGEFGSALYARQDALVASLAARLSVPDRLLEPVRLEFAADDLKLSGWLTGLSAAGLSLYTLNDIKPRDYPALWIKHLALCLAAPADVERVSRLAGTDGSVAFQAPDDPAAEMARLLRYYWQGLHQPLAFFPKSSYAYAKKSQADGDSAQALAAARKVWEKPEFRNGPQYGESENPWYRAVYRDSEPFDAAFEELAMDLLGPMFAALDG